jgi:hypothetical protein
MMLLWAVGMLAATVPSNGQPQAAVPLFRDPVHDGAADPVAVWNRAKKTWWMFYTNRRADIEDTSGVRSTSAKPTSRSKNPTTRFGRPR